MTFVIRIFPFPLFSSPLRFPLPQEIMYQEQGEIWVFNRQWKHHTLCSSKVDLLQSQVTDLFFSVHHGTCQEELGSASQWACLVWGSLSVCPVSTCRLSWALGMSVLRAFWLFHLSSVCFSFTLQTVGFFRILSFLLKPAQAIPQLGGSQRTKQFLLIQLQLWSTWRT